MEIDKTLVLPAPPERVWALLLDPAAMGACVPGMESVQVLSDDAYAAVMKVKISFVSARFKLHTRIVERHAPRYLRAEGTGDDSAVASSLKQVSEMWLDAGADGNTTTLRVKVQVDVLGRIGSFGLAAMKTKADRLWDEFGVNLAARLAPQADTQNAPGAAMADPGTSTLPDAASHPGAEAKGPEIAPAGRPAAPAMPGLSLPGTGQRVVVRARPGVWQRVFGRTADPIRVELRRGDTHLVVQFPVEAAADCVAWLRTLTDATR